MIRRPITIIAEAGVNHNGSLEIAKKLIDVAAEAGADYVKFQTFKAGNLVSKSAKKAEYQIKNTGNGNEGQYEMLKKLEIDKATHEILINHCLKQSIKFLSTPFDLDSIDLLDSLNVELYKIPSGEITNLPYLNKIAGKLKPVILSTGMATLGEIETALNILTNKLRRDQITVLHCNTEYPTPFTDVNLSAMKTIESAFKINVGYSDHTLGIEIPIAAVAMGAVCIEKHFTLDKTLEGPDHKASLEPSELIQMVKAIRNVEIALGNGIKRPSLSEQKNIVIARKSIHINKDLPSGHVLEIEDLSIKRPGNGISPMEIYSIVGRKLRVKKVADSILDYTEIL